MSGITSGEGIIHRVRDPLLDEDGNLKEKNGNVIDAGVTDKRGIVFEAEFSSLLKVAARPGNTVSEIIRKMFEGGTLENTNKNSSERATRPHLAMVGHITMEELVNQMPAVEMANGFCNRMLWIYTASQKKLPRPPVFKVSDNLINALQGFASNCNRITNITIPDGEVGDYWDCLLYTSDAADE